MRYLLVAFVCLVTSLSFAQSKWEYGVNLQFNSGLIKPISSDTFTNKPGFGAGLFLEREFKNYSLQGNLNYSHIQYENDFLNISHVSNNADLLVSFLKPLDKNQQTHFIVGGILGYNLGYAEYLLSGGSLRPVQNQLIVSNSFDFGAHIGIGLDLSKGSRLTISYHDFFAGKQSGSFIDGRIDYLQLGVQLRINELSDNEKSLSKSDNTKKASKTARKHIQALKSDGNGILVFVIPTKDSKALGLLETRDPIKRDSLRRARIASLRDSIDKFYTYGDFVITTDSLLAFPSRKLRILTHDEVIEYKIPETKVVYYAKIDELFLSENDILKWGVFVFDNNLNMLQEPFPFFTPYRQFDKKFEKADQLIIQFNRRLQEFQSYSE